MYCFGQCDTKVVLAAVGLQLADLFDGERPYDPFWEQQRRDRERLALLERQNGLSIMAQAVEPDHRSYWAAVERNTASRIIEVRDKLFPEERRQRETQRIIADYTMGELWDCLPNQK